MDIQENTKNNKLNIGILCSKSLSEFNLAVLKLILDDSRFKISVLIIDNRPAKSFWQKIKKNYKRARGGYMLIMLAKKLVKSKGSKLSISSMQFCGENNISLLKTKNPYTPDFLRELKTFNLDVMILQGGFGIIKKPLIDFCSKGILSYHHGNMRKYRGMPPVFWELYNGENEIGATVQILSEKLDAGIPISEISIPLIKSDNLVSARNRLYLKSIPMMHESLLKINERNFVYPTPIESLGSVYTLPNLRQWLEFQFKLFFNRVNITK